MKYIFFDLDSNALLSKDNGARPFIDVVLKYCVYSKLRIVGLTASETHCNAVSKIFNINFEWLDKNQQWPWVPDLIISDNNEYAKLPLIIVPPFNGVETTNEFAELSLAGRLLASIKDRVVLNRNAPEKQISQDTAEPNNDKDASGWAFGI